MSTREENMKKLNEELEKLSDEQLEQVAGGTPAEVSDDSKLLYEYGIINKYYEPLQAAFKYCPEVDEGWSKVGIKCESRYGVIACGNNRYKLNGTEISAKQARAHLMKNYKQVRSIYLERC